MSKMIKKFSNSLKTKTMYLLQLNETVSNIFTHKPPTWFWVILGIAVLGLITHIIINNSKKLRLRDLLLKERLIVISQQTGKQPLVQMMDDFQKDRIGGKEPTTNLFYLSKKDVCVQLKIGSVYEVTSFDGQNILTLTDVSVSVPTKKLHKVA